MATETEAQAQMHESTATFDSKEFDYPLEGTGENGEGGMGDNSLKRSALKKVGQSRSAQNSSMLLKVAFRDVHLREYGMVLGDNPAVSHGAPVQLDWEPQECHDPVHIDNYEKARSLWRAKDRRGFLLNAHKRVKILFAAGYTIDEIAKATMEMKELRQLRADSLKTQGMMTGAIMALLSGAAETTGTTVRAVTILPNAMAGVGMAVVQGTNKAIVGGATEMMGLTSKVVNGTAKAAQVSGHAITDLTMEGVKGTGKVVKGTGDLMVKGTMGLVTGTTKVVSGTGKIGLDAVKGTSNVLVGGTTSVLKGTVKGTGVLFSGTAGVMKASHKRLSRMVSSGMDSSSHSGGLDDSSRHGEMDESERSRGSIFGNVPGLPKINKLGSRKSMGDSSNGHTGLGLARPKSITRQRSLDSAQAAAAEKGNEVKMTDELADMQDFLTQLEGMDKKKVQEIVAEEQHKKKNRVKSFAKHMSPTPHVKKNRGTSLAIHAVAEGKETPEPTNKSRGMSLLPLSLSRKFSTGTSPRPDQPVPELTNISSP